MRNHDVGAEWKNIASATKDWCYRHHTDISGWTFLSFRLFGPRAPETPEARGAAYVEIARLAASLRWENESVWAFLRTVAASGFAGPEAEDEFLRSIKTVMDKTQEGSVEAVTLRRAEAWFRTDR